MGVELQTFYGVNPRTSQNEGNSSQSAWDPNINEDRPIIRGLKQTE